MMKTAVYIISPYTHVGSPRRLEQPPKGHVFLNNSLNDKKPENNIPAIDIAKIVFNANCLFILLMFYYKYLNFTFKENFYILNIFFIFMDKVKAVVWTILSKLLGLIIFLILVFLLNSLKFFIDNLIYSQIVDFVNKNILIILVIFIMFFIAELFELLQFPLNLPAPLLNALGAVFVVSFIFKIFDFIDVIIGQNVFFIFRGFSFFVYLIVFLIVLIVGYVNIFSNMEHIESHKHKRKIRH